MPNYDYECPIDGTSQNMIASHSDVVSCSKCGHDMIRQFPRRTRIVFGSTGGASLTDVYDRDFRQMELDGEL